MEQREMDYYAVAMNYASPFINSRVSLVWQALRQKRSHSESEYAGGK
jgi:hypothetical protein